MTKNLALVGLVFALCLQGCASLVVQPDDPPEVVETKIKVTAHRVRIVSKLITLAIVQSMDDEKERQETGTYIYLVASGIRNALDSTGSDEPLTIEMLKNFVKTLIKDEGKSDVERAIASTIFEGVAMEIELLMVERFAGAGEGVGNMAEWALVRAAAVGVMEGVEAFKPPAELQNMWTMPSEANSMSTLIISPDESWVVPPITEDDAIILQFE